MKDRPVKCKLGKDTELVSSLPDEGFWLGYRQHFIWARPSFNGLEDVVPQF